MAKILSMLGNTYKITGETLCGFSPADFILPGNQLTLDRDALTNRRMILVEAKDYTCAYIYSMVYDIWIKYDLNFLKYNQLDDIRKSYLHENRYNAKAKTNGSNTNVSKLSANKRH